LVVEVSGIFVLVVEDASVNVLSVAVFIKLLEVEKEAGALVNVVKIEVF